MCWLHFENELLKEFQGILTLFDEIKNEINEDTRKDFLGLLQYTLKSRSNFRLIAAQYGCSHNFNSCSGKSATVDPNEIVDELLTKDLDSFASEYSNFPLVFENSDNIPLDSLVKLCVKYWKHRYPSVKTSFIIPLSVKHPKMMESSELKTLLARRLLKGKLEPFDESIQICKILGISPDATDFFDPQLAALKDLLRNHQQLQLEQSCALQQSGCHCD